MKKSWKMFKKHCQRHSGPRVLSLWLELSFLLNWICIHFSFKDHSSFRLNTLGPLCLWQCFFLKVHFTPVLFFSSKQYNQFVYIRSNIWSNIRTNFQSDVWFDFQSDFQSNIQCKMQQQCSLCFWSVFFSWLVSCLESSNFYLFLKNPCFSSLFILSFVLVLILTSSTS